MRPPILWISVAFGAGLWTGLDAFQVRGAWYVVAPVLVGAAALHRRAPLGAALGIMAAAGVLWGGAAVRERDDSCAGRWSREPGGSREQGAGSSKAAIVQLGDAASASGGLVEADVVPGACGGALRLRWPEGYRAAGGTTWVVAGRWTGFGERGVLVVRRAHQLDPTPRGRGALRGRLAERAAALFGTRAPLGAARCHRALRRGAAARGSVGVAFRGRLALGHGDRRRDLGRPCHGACPPRAAARGARAGGDDRHRAHHRARLRHRGADRRGREPRGDPARRRRRPGTRAGARAVVGVRRPRAVTRRGCGAGPGAARSHRHGRRSGTRRARRDDRGLAGGGALGRGRPRRV